MDIIVNWFILILVSVFDPLAVSLVIAANHLSHKETEKDLPPEDDDSSSPPKEKKVVEDVADVSDPIKEIKIQDVVVKKKQKNKKEKKPLAVSDEISILDENETQKAFYQEPSIQPANNGYRRGVSL
jgi:hypothetical protein